MKRKERQKNLIILLLILVVSLGIGYAFLTQELTINGTSKVNASTWNVYFDNLVPNPNNVALSTGDVAATIDSTTDTDITYTVTLQQPGDFYEFTVDVVNGGSIDAMVGSVSNKLGGVEIDTTHPVPPYLIYSVSYADGVAISPNHLLAHGETENFKVRVEYKKNLSGSELPSTSQTLSFSFSVEYVQADENATSKPNFVLPVGRTVDTLQVGDEICLNKASSECFNFIRYDGNDVVMLAKYNLKVGNDYAYDSGAAGYLPSYSYTSSDIGYGLQSSDMRGWLDGETTINGIVTFAYTNYWDDNGLKAKYGSSYPADVFDLDYLTEPNFSSNGFGTDGYSIAYYVNQYKNLLTGSNYNVSIKSARLLSYLEATDSSIGCSNTTCPLNSFISNTSFWLGTANSGSGVKIITTSGDLSNQNYYVEPILGVRPVIVVEKANM